MAAVAHVSPAPIRRLEVVRTRPVAGAARTTLPVTVYRRRRAVALLMLVTLVAALALAMQSVLASFGGGSLTDSRRPEAPTGTYVVQPGDTFWSIAGQLRPDEDPRPLVARMVAGHGSPVLTAGERLTLPAAA